MRTSCCLAFFSALQLVLFCVPTVLAAPRSFIPCSAASAGVGSTAIGEFSPLVSEACVSASATVLGGGQATSTASAFATASGVGAIPEQLGDISPVPVTTTVTGTSISASSFDRILLSVPGGDAGNSTAAGLTTLTNPVRPAGNWVTTPSIDVSSSPETVFADIMEIVPFLEIAFKDLGVTVEPTTDGVAGRALVEFFGEGEIIFDTDLTTPETLALVLVFTEVSPEVFPGFDFQGTRIYVQVIPPNIFGVTTFIEMGWEPLPGTPVSETLTRSARFIETVLFEMLSNLAFAFGKICDSATNVRTVEGECNNLANIEQGSANEALRRLGGTDPAYPGGDPANPSGPLDINVREISNALFAMSPGSSILEDQLRQLKGVCISAFAGTLPALVCPLAVINLIGAVGRSVKIPFIGVKSNECEDLILSFSTPQCTIDLRLKCAGEASVDLAEDPCGAETNRLFHPVGCATDPGDDDVLANPDGLTDMFFTFAQFIDHDYGLSPLSQINADQPGLSRLSREPELEIDFPIEVPENDFHFGDREEFEFTRARFAEDDDTSQINLHSSYLDGSQIYGVDFRRARLLRTFRGGELLLSDGVLPPFNRVEGPGALGTVVDNGPNTDGRFFVVGDARGNEQLLLLATHIVFLREHNLIARELAAAFPQLAEDDEILYQTARAIVIAEYQCIVYKEFLPFLLGDAAPDPNGGSYDEGVDPTVSAIFTTSAFRFGHSMVGTNLLRMGPGPTSSADTELIPIRDAFFKPEEVVQFGVDPFLRGGAWHLCKELDNKVVDELRNFLVIDFEVEVTEPPLFDLVALNLQRGRDMGLPSFNDVRELFDLPRYDRFSDFVSDPNLADLAAEIYDGDVELVDSFFGGMVEESVDGGQLGETFSKIVADQFTRSRDGDRFFFTRLEFLPELVERIPRVQHIIDQEVKFGDLILRTTGITAAELGNRESVFQVA